MDMHLDAISPRFACDVRPVRPLDLLRQHLAILDQPHIGDLRRHELKRHAMPQPDSTAHGLRRLVPLRREPESPR